MGVSGTRELLLQNSRYVGASLALLLLVALNGYWRETVRPVASDQDGHISREEFLSCGWAAPMDSLSWWR